MIASFGRLGTRAATAGWRATDGRPPARIALLGAGGRAGVRGWHLTAGRQLLADPTRRARRGGRCGHGLPPGAAPRGLPSQRRPDARDERAAVVVRAGLDSDVRRSGLCTPVEPGHLIILLDDGDRRS